MKNKKKPKKKISLLLVDASFIAHRSFHRFPHLCTKKGEPTGAIFGFMQTLQKLPKDFPGYRIVIVFDNQINLEARKHPTYKKDRREHAPIFKTQLKIIKSLVEYAGLDFIDIPDREADEVIGYIINNMITDGSLGDFKNVFIYGEDTDFYQLLRVEPFKVMVINTSKDRYMTYDDFTNKHHYDPKYYPIAKAIAGDKTDNLPGIKGIGKKTADKLVLEILDRSDKKKTVYDRFMLVLSEVLSKRNLTQPELEQEMARIVSNLWMVHFDIGLSSIFTNKERQAIIAAFKIPISPSKTSLIANAHYLELNNFINNLDEFLASYRR